ncbi:MAG: glycosyltransferase family 1 protein [Thermodesulfobacteriota bacterium]
MRIAIVTDAWHPQVSGVVTTYSETVSRLRQRGQEVLTVTPAEFRTVPCPSYPGIPLALFPGREVHRRLTAFRPDSIHIATEGPLGWAARAFCLRQGLGFTTAYHTRFPEYVQLRLPLPLSLLYRVVRRFHAPAVRTMVATDDLHQELAARGFGHLCRWSRGVDTELFRPRDKDFLSGARPIAMYMGRVAVEKNIEAFLRLELPGTKYVVGDGPAREGLERRYPAVRFVGTKRGEELARHLAAADLFVFPSRTDTFGVVLLEALACGVPVAAYPVTGPRQVVREGVNGYLDENLGRAARRALTLDANRCRQSVLAFSWEACTDQFCENLYRIAPAGQDIPALAWSPSNR